MTTTYGPLAMTSWAAFKRIEASFKAHNERFMPKIEQNGVDIHRNLSGIIFNYWASLDEDICYLEIKDFRTLYQKKESQWLENIDSQVFRNSKDAKMWLIKEVSKYCGFTARNY